MFVKRLKLRLHLSLSVTKGAAYALSREISTRPREQILSSPASSASHLVKCSAFLIKSIACKDRLAGNALRKEYEYAYSSLEISLPSCSGSSCSSFRSIC